MADQGFITQAAAKTALTAPAEVPERVGAGSVNYAADYVMDVLDDFIGAVEGDVSVLTTIDSKLQASAETTLVDALSAQGAKPGRVSVFNGPVFGPEDKPLRDALVPLALREMPRNVSGSL